MRLWWKAHRDPSQLHPEVKMVYDVRVGHTFQRRYWVHAPEAKTAEERHKLAEEALQAAKVLEQYKNYDEGYAFVRRNWFDIPGRQMTMGHWENIVIGAHKRLKEAFGGDRVAVFIPMEQAPEELRVAAEASDKKANIPLLALVRGVDADLTDRILKDFGLPPFYYFAIGSAVTGENYLVRHLRKWMADMHIDVWGEVVRDTMDLGTKPVPTRVIHPGSKNPVYFDEYFTRHKSDLVEQYSEGLWDAKKEFEGELKEQVEKAKAMSLGKVFKDSFGGLHKDVLREKGENLSKFADWLKEHPGAFKVWLSFLLPEEEHDTAILAYYAFAKTANDYITYMLTRDPHKKVPAAELLSFLQKKFEHWADEGRKELGLGGVTASTETLLKTLDITLRRYRSMGFGWGDVDAPEVNVRMLTATPVWSHLKNPHVREDFKEVAEALVGEPLKEGFEEFPQDKRFFDAVLSLGDFATALRYLGAKALGERKMLRGLDYDYATLKAHARHAINKFYYDLSHVVRKVAKAREVLESKGVLKPESAKGYAVAVVGFSPADFHTLTRDLFWGDNEQAYRIGTVENSYVLRVFVPGRGMVAGAWGILDPDKKAMYVAGRRRGIINSPALKKISASVASVLFGSPPEDLKTYPVGLGGEAFEVSVGGAEQK